MLRGRKGKTMNMRLKSSGSFITFAPLSQMTPCLQRSSLNHPQKVSHHVLGRQADPGDMASSCLFYCLIAG